ncbi:MAG: hypothetical protein B9S34_02625 [Opitutia bacterium Tous-C1TDCM]|nr:MAG: hypothetical protein B9S34_02625 [Opitutae bacterium Tous-C1TDCM]
MTPSGPAPRRRAPVSLLLAALVAWPAAAQVTGLRGFRDHSLCCALGMPSIHGADGAFDSAPDPVLSRRRAPAPPAPDAAPPPIVRLPGPPLSDLDGPLKYQSGYAKIGFSQLAGFDFAAPPQPVAENQPLPDVLAGIPASIRRLDGRKVVLTGFILPTKMEAGFAKEFFFLSSSQLCCFGVTPSLNDLIVVRMKDEGLPAVQDVPVSLAGIFRVRAQWTAGYLESIYELEGHGLLKTKD